MSDESDANSTADTTSPANNLEELAQKRKAADLEGRWPHKCDEDFATSWACAANAVASMFCLPRHTKRPRVIKTHSAIAMASNGTLHNAIGNDKNRD